jgi:hypothetical protein
MLVLTSILHLVTKNLFRQEQTIDFLTIQLLDFLGKAFAKEGRLKEAEEHFRKGNDCFFTTL